MSNIKATDEQMKKVCKLVIAASGVEREVKDDEIEFDQSGVYLDRFEDKKVGLIIDRCGYADDEWLMPASQPCPYIKSWSHTYPTYQKLFAAAGVQL